MLQNSDGSSRLSATFGDEYVLYVETSFPGWPEGDSARKLSLNGDIALFQSGIAPARTFAFADEVAGLLQSGLARGGSLSNVVIITPPDTFSSELRMDGEWWRHKVLDLIGDLALVDARLKCSVSAVRPGHWINTQLAAALAGGGSAKSQEL
jgi:UDP-3-O-[3-hydroxymyristoyl] N-acetylglucosamine deacetylase/3-hydroxyacyl-[acyl-carrier-protein] dehydratase